MARRKAQTIDVPSSLDEALVKVASYVADDRGSLKVRLHYEAAIDRLKAERDLMLVAVDAVQKQRFAALKAWWEAGGKDLAGKKRSAELAGATLGMRLTTPKLGFVGKLGEVAALDWLRTMGLTQFIRTKPDLDKAGIIAALARREGCDASLAGLLDTTFEAKQTNEFFIDTGLDEAVVRRELDGTIS